jgi:hypothetical protein
MNLPFEIHPTWASLQQIIRIFKVQPQQAHYAHNWVAIIYGCIMIMPFVNILLCIIMFSGAAELSQTTCWLVYLSGSFWWKLKPIYIHYDTWWRHKTIQVQHPDEQVSLFVQPILHLVTSSLIFVCTVIYLIEDFTAYKALHDFHICLYNLDIFI